MKHLLLLCFSLFILGNNYAQTTVSVTVNNANITTTCSDPFGGDPDPLFQVNINGEGYTTYPQEGACFTALPNVQYSNTVNCAQDVGSTVNVCFKVFENDGLLGCNISESCTEEICQDFLLPVTGSGNFNLALPAGGDSGGSLSFSIDVTGFPLTTPNDEVCDAVDLGTLDVGSTLGSATDVQNNSCATFSAGELNPCDFSSTQCNQNGVWYSFTTGNEGIAQITINADSDPENTGDGFPIQLAIFQALDGTCSGNFDYLAQDTDYSDDDALLELTCLEANTTYYIMVDGSGINGIPSAGAFTLEVNTPAFPPAPDLPCDAYSFGAIPLNASLSLPTPMGNQCASTPGDPTTIGFGSQNSVWFSFSPSVTGHVLIEAISNAADPINLQVAVYTAFQNSCTAPFNELISSWDGNDFDESIELSCLDPDLVYFILVDGEPVNGPGYFNIIVSDPGFNWPVTDNTEVLCAGGSVTVAGNTYTTTGMYTDTLPVGNNCFEVINTDLTVLDELIADVAIIEAASDEFEADGEVQVNVVGGDGNYIYTWSNGFDQANPTNLSGGQPYCVTVSDGAGCEDEVCFEMPYIDFILPTVTEGSLACFEDEDGVITFSAENGFPPYTYSWSGNGLSGNGGMNENEVISLNDLAAGTYSITINDGQMDTVFQAQVTQPPELFVNDAVQTNVSCFGACDGSIALDVVGGTPPYNFQWSEGSNTQTPGSLCAGTYEVTIIDANLCETVENYTLNEPPEFIATASATQSVSCFGGSDGAASITTNGNPTAYLWFDNSDQADISGLSAGEYFVTVTYEDGCEDIASVIIEQPEAPLSVSLEVITPITCNGSSDAAVRSTVTGPGTDLIYLWSNGETSTTIENLPAGDYSVTVENENACMAEANITVTEPEEIVFDFTTKDITCADGEFSGELQISSITGGAEPYVFSVNGQNYGSPDTITGLAEGTYAVELTDDLGCIRNYDFSILPPPELVVTLENEREDFRLGEEVELSPTVSSTEVIYEWSSSKELPEDCAAGNCEILVDMPTGTTLYQVFVTDTITACSAEASILIRVNRERFVFFPTAFSPDDDGINDKFTMFGTEAVEMVKTFRVYDRNGGLMHDEQDFMPEDPETAWDGTFNGQRLDTGVYVWVAEISFIDGETEVFSGSITLLR